MAKKTRKFQRQTSTNRVEELRNSIKITQADLADFATDYIRMHGDEDNVIINQTIQRLEKGKIELTTEWLEILAGAFTLAGLDVQPWHLITPKEEIEQADEQRELWDNWQKLSEQEQDIYKGLIESRVKLKDGKHE